MESSYSMARQNVRIGYFDDCILRFTEYGILVFVILATLLGNYLSYSNLMNDPIVF